MAATIWKGTLRWEDEAVPVRVHSAIEDRSIHFHLLHDQDTERLQQRLVHPETNETVDPKEARRALEIERGVFVLIEKEELDELVPQPSRDIHVLGFSDPSRVNHQWYERPYFLSPDGDASLYFAMANAIERSGLEGIAKWVMRRKEYLGALRAYDGYLVMITLRHAGEVILLEEIAPAAETTMPRELSTKEIQLARQIVSALSDEFHPERFHDEYRERVRELIERKRAGRPPPPVEEEIEPAVPSLEDALEASLEAMR